MQQGMLSSLLLSLSLLTLPVAVSAKEMRGVCGRTVASGYSNSNQSF